MSRRPHGQAAAPQRKLFLALALFLLNPALRLVDAQQQQQHPRQPSGHDTADQLSQHVFHRLAADAGRQLPIAASSDSSASSRRSNHQQQKQQAQAAMSYSSPAEAESFIASQLTVETPKIQRKRTSIDNGRGSDSTVPVEREREREAGHRKPRTRSTAAPDLSVRAPSLAYRDLAAAAPGQNLPSPHLLARTLADWEVEHFVLLATVDGDLLSVDRKTGKIQWHIESEKPVVETKHHRSNVSTLDESFLPLDHWIWAVEPTRSGAIYLMIPGSPSLAETGLSMKWLVEQVPYYDRNHPVVFTGTKSTTMVTLDAATGRVRAWYGTGEADSDAADAYNSPDSCMRPNNFGESGGEECAVGGSITLGRTDYKVIVRRNDGITIATLKYSEWGPNNYDKDLHQQHKAPSDNRYISGLPNGDVYGFSFDPVVDGVKLAFSHRLSAPIARVFDIARPPHVPLSSYPDLAVLPQPPPPAEDDEAVRLRKSTIFINETKGGSWYALSGTSYPLILDVPAAECTEAGWWDRHQTSGPAEIRNALTGKHSLSTGAERQRSFRAPEYPTLPGSDASATVSDDDVEDLLSPPLTLPEPATEPSPYVITKVKELPQVAANSVLDFLSNPVFIIAFATFLFLYQKDLRRWYRKKKQQWFDKGVALDTSDDESSSVIRGTADGTDTTAKVQPADLSQSGLLSDKEDGASERRATRAGSAETTTATADQDKGNAPTSPASVSTSADGEMPAPEKEKKKAHRGRRGGAKHRKGNKNKVETSQSRGDEPVALATVDEVVGLAKELGEKRPGMEPDILTVPSNVQEVSGPILRMGSLEVDEDQQLGTGSNGTIVFAGRFDGREVAVKRMLVQFYDIASQETKLLRESDDHPNVIRYFAQQQRAAFHYIALELCEASLAEVIEKPFAFRELAQAGERDLPNVLYQITSGLNHLHSRNIVHRDLKPQNILVNKGPNGKPRLLISDFGLCKKLEGGQSSFGATTAHAAGTSGWRAPELLLDDDARDSGTTLVEAMSTQSGGSHGLLAGHGEGQPPMRRATKAIDVFGLGLVFFYVLTKGSHPFDCGDRYMREVNIRKGNYNLEPLGMLGDVAPEAKDLISHMLRANPRQRPRTREVMAHPFFWPPKKRLAFLCDVSDHYEKEPRDPPSEALLRLESRASEAVEGDFLRQLPRDFVDSLGKQRKYNGTRLLDLLRALRNKRNHYEDMTEPLRRLVGSLPEGYLNFWAVRFPCLLLVCWKLGFDEDWEATDRFTEYYQPSAGV
ncbi:protein kinase and ribonuclease [Grosmannia clavigera kw1407]|uniref:non-specific serine/threonine protein kinase n=1 Tax=Grosmannia clavigera (strain kw1407 / UAMH 11150) TaxID=655863 RepID=F0XQU2_GROCL|nr:protein kinase and ribonuclease [Grosmannia clavigera kw1407]EFW99769.1 protein kinase and ribonuclease [Grosmannia clavigera kw1407]